MEQMKLFTILFLWLGDGLWWVKMLCCTIVVDASGYSWCFQSHYDENGVSAGWLAVYWYDRTDDGSY